MKEFTLPKVYQLPKPGPLVLQLTSGQGIVDNILLYNLDKHLISKYTHD